MGESSADHCENRLAEVLKLIKAVDNASVLVTMRELAQFREVQNIFPPNFNKENCGHACVVGGEEVLTLILEEQGTHKLFVDTSTEKWSPPVTEEDWIVLCQALCQSIKEEE